MATTVTTPASTTQAYLNEAPELERVVTRLLEQYPRVGETVVRDVVATSTHMFDDATVRKFVPLLVERLARAALNERRVIDPDASAG
ncbi:MAG TPA: hypothetical protein VHZ96_13690 [Frankiaceae bacterium]|jgi:hypothetical protein|nr:hypothetical protein [Frankiaceae bacterium]